MRAAVAFLGIAAVGVLVAQGAAITLLWDIAQTLHRVLP